MTTIEKRHGSLEAVWQTFIVLKTREISTKTSEYISHLTTSNTICYCITLLIIYQYVEWNEISREIINNNIRKYQKNVDIKPVMITDTGKINKSPHVSWKLHTLEVIWGWILCLCRQKWEFIRCANAVLFTFTIKRRGHLIW